MHAAHHVACPDEIVAKRRGEVVVGARQLHNGFTDDGVRLATVQPLERGELRPSETHRLRPNSNRRWIAYGWRKVTRQPGIGLHSREVFTTN